MVCKKCAHENYCVMVQFGGHVPLITACSKFKEKSQTNADRIRAMTDEELAEWINKHDCHTNLYGYDPKEAILVWLKQEVESNG